MMKLILFVLLPVIVSVQSKITAMNKTLLIKAGDPFTLQCDNPSGKWKLNGKTIVNCGNCSSSACNIDEAYKNRITAFCKQGYSVLHFNSTQIGDKGTLKCPASESDSSKLLVGNYNTAHFHSENKYPFALNQKNYTLVCDKVQGGDMIWYNEEGKMLIYFDNDCSGFESDYDKTRFDITCDAKQKKGRFHIKQVSLSQDGNIIGCESAKVLYLFRLTVNVPVTSVSIQLKSQDLLEDKDGIFVCKVEVSKPEASFQWIIAYQNGSLQEIQQNSSISKTAKGTLWQTTSTLRLKLKRDYKKIMCKARIENMPWTNSGYQLLDIKYAPEGKPRIILSQSKICAGKMTEIKCEWKGGYPEANVRLSCLSEVKEGQSSISIKKTVTQEMSRFCICYGKHIAKEENITKELDIQYPPNKVTVSQTSYLEGETASLICEVSGGNPEPYNYTWSPGNYPPVNVIKINLTRALNKQTLTCDVYHKCKGDNPVSSTIKLNVEYYPIINTIDKMTVIENKTNEFSCLVEGNPKPTITWKIKNQIFKSKLLQVSFTRYNESDIQCIATANSSKHGTLKSSKNISIFVTYPPEITIHHKVSKLQGKAEISFTAQARPNNIQYKIIQKWGNNVKRVITARQKNFQNVLYEDLGTWICQASNDVPYKGYYTNKSVEIKHNVSAHFKGNTNETAIVGSEKLLKICFYCYPDAMDVKWYKGNEEMPSDRISYISAEDGLFPFPGNCSILKLDIGEKETQSYSLKVINPVGERTFELTLDSGIPPKTPIYIIITCVIAVVVIFIIAGIVCFKYRRSLKKKESNKNLVDNNNSVDDGEMVNNAIYDHFSGVSNNAASQVEPLYAQVNKTSKPSTKINRANPADLYAKIDKSGKTKTQGTNENPADLYAKIDKSGKTQSQGTNVSQVEPLYAQVNKTSTKINRENPAALYANVDKSGKTQSQGTNASQVEPLYAQVNKTSKPSTKINRENPADLYANIDKSGKTQSQGTNASQVEPLYAQVNKTSKPSTKINRENPPDLYANGDKLKPQAKGAKAKKRPAQKPVPNIKPKLQTESNEDIYENLEMKEKQARDKDELMYAELDFNNKAKTKQKPIKTNDEDQTMYASIDFSTQ